MDIQDLSSAPRPTTLSTDVSYEEYAAIPALRSGVMKDGLLQDADGYVISPRHIQASYRGTIDKEGESLMFGKALHCLMFEPEVFERDFCYFDGRRDARTKAYQDFLQENGSKTILKKSGSMSYDWCLWAAEAFCECPVIKPFTEKGAAEVTGQAVIEDVPVKARFDWISASRECIVDLKTSQSVGPRDFWGSWKRYGYGVQMALYREVYKLITGNTLPVYIIALENHPPFVAVVYEVPVDLLDRDAMLVYRVCETVRGCLETGEWPSFAGQDIVPLCVPDWEMEASVIDWDS